MTDTSITSSLLNQPTGNSQTTKGKKGFQSKSIRSTINITFRVTPEQAKAIKQECKERGVTISQLVRAGLECYLKPYNEGGDIDLAQLSIWND